MISIIIPVYNAAPYLIRCIDSILNQDYKNFELLLINDGSTDKSGEICNQYALKDQRIQVFHQHNQGVSAARNLGIQKAKGKWIQFIDSDDWIENDFIIKNISYISQENDLIVSGYKIDEITKQYKFELKQYTFDGNDFIKGIKYLYQNDCVGMNWNKLFNRKVIISNDIQFKKDLNYGEDELFVLNYLKHVHRITTTPNSGYHYVSNQTNSLSKKTIPIKERIKIATLLYEAGTKIREENKYILFFKQIYTRYIYFSFLQNYNTNKYINKKEKNIYLPKLYDMMHNTNFCNELIQPKRRIILKLIFLIKNTTWINMMFYIDNKRIKIQKRILHQ